MRLLPDYLGAFTVASGQRSPPAALLVQDTDCPSGLSEATGGWISVLYLGSQFSRREEAGPRAR